MQEKQKTNKGVIIIIVLLVLLIVAMVGVIVALLNRPSETRVAESQTGNALGYAEGVTVVEDPDALQKAVDEMYEEAAKGGVTLEYKNGASSTDGETFECYIANAVENGYDMYIDIYADAALTDHLFLSGLIRPGQAFDNIRLEHKLDPGDHQVYVAFTQVEEDLATIHAQVMVTMDFTVVQ